MTHHCLLPEEKLLEKLNGKNVKYILLTHGHFDHICGAKMVKDAMGAKVVIHKDDEIMLHDVSKNEFDMNCQGYDFPDLKLMQIFLQKMVLSLCLVILKLQLCTHRVIQWVVYAIFLRKIW